MKPVHGHVREGKQVCNRITTTVYVRVVVLFRATDEFYKRNIRTFRVSSNSVSDNIFFFFYTFFFIRHCKTYV